MPVDLKIDTDGKTENKRIEVVGTDSPFTMETFGRPRRISIDPDHHVLTNSTDVKLRAADPARARRCSSRATSPPRSPNSTKLSTSTRTVRSPTIASPRCSSSSAITRPSANAYRESLNGDGEPRWTEVWSHIQLGKIFDITGQRERAINEYRQAVQTNDNTFGALKKPANICRKPTSAPKKSSSRAAVAVLPRELSIFGHYMHPNPTALNL